MDLEVGQLVKSLSGRDKGKLYLVIGFVGNRVLLADGRNRPVNNPKPKNSKHLQPYRLIIDQVSECLRQGNLNDVMIRNSLKPVLTGDIEHEPDHPPCLESSSANGD